MLNIRMTVALLVLLAASQAYADRITLTSGRTIEGVVLQEEETRVQFELDGTPVWIEKRHVKSLTRSAAKPAKSAEPVSETTDAAAASAPNAVDVKKLLKRLGAKDPNVRAAAAKDVVTAWPASATVVDEALQARAEALQIEAVRLLDREELGDTQARLRRALQSESAQVRLLAARVVRHREYRGLEPELIRLMRSDSEWKVQQEALRALEVVGSRRCLQPVVAQLSSDEDEAHARRYRRVLEKLLGKRHGDDIDAWREAVEKVLYGGGKLAHETTARR